MFCTLCVIMTTILQHNITKWLRYLVAGSTGYVQNTQGHSLFQLLKRLIHSIMFIAYIGCSVKLCWTYCVATENQGHTIIKTSGECHISACNCS